MSEDSKTDNSIEEQITRISNNFESDILRLIKTQSMIKASGGIIDEEIKYLISKTQQFREKLNELSLKTSELSDLLQVTFQDKDLSSTHVGLYLNEFISSITKESIDIKTLNQELADRLENGSEKLKSLHNFYIAELEAFQQEVDSGLDIIREDIKEKIKDEIKPEEETELPSDDHQLDPVSENHIENKEEYYQKMFSSSNAQESEGDSDDIFNYIAIGFLVLCAVGFLGYYLKYIQPNSTGKMVVIEDLYEEETQNGKQTYSVNDNQNDPYFKSKEENVPADKGVKSDLLPGNANIGNSEDYIFSDSNSDRPINKNFEFDSKILVKRANVRKGPGKSNGVIAIVTYGTRVAMLDEQSGIWTKIRLQDGMEGWVAKKLLSK